MKPGPVRLADPASGAPAAVRALLEEGARELPDAAALARLARRLPLGTPPTLPPAAAPPALLWPVAGLVVALAAVGAALGYNAATAPPPPAPPVAMTATTVAAVATSAPSAIPTVPASAPAHVEAARPEAPAALPAKPAPAPSASVLGEGEPEDTLLQRAQAALGADPARALALTREHERRFPRGALGQEREVLAVSALVALGRTTEARARAARFAERFPRSAYLPRIKALVPEPAP